ncbi:unnamed protein product [Penicillium camemberti]|uniref:Str. FM013 n=1 Tax=Penicillium camemberti (strain FM 013) TaxID=1429867 RepID=A0A0G4PVM5_PENC3|nr:unnamed protein product [Penicillium camemberti]
MNEVARRWGPTAGCIERAITRIWSNLRFFGSFKVPPMKAGRPRHINPVMRETLDVLHCIGWSKKTARWKAKEHNPDLRHNYYHPISECSSYQPPFRI